MSASLRHLDQARQLLEHVPWYQALPEAAREALLEGCEWRVLPGGAVLFFEGETSDSAYLVLSGSLGAFKRDENGETTPKPRVFINPEIISRSEDMSVYEEGCLSIPEYYEEVERPARVRVRFIDLDGKVHEEDAEGLYATCIQHEIDHLNGVLFVDYLSKLKRDRVLKKFTKAAKRATE